jgi:hypothetical protein
MNTRTRIGYQPHRMPVPQVSYRTVPPPASRSRGTLGGPPHDGLSPHITTQAPATATSPHPAEVRIGLSGAPTTRAHTTPLRTRCFPDLRQSQNRRTASCRSDPSAQTCAGDRPSESDCALADGPTSARPSSRSHHSVEPGWITDGPQPGAPPLPAQVPKSRPTRPDNSFHNSRCVSARYSFGDLSHSAPRGRASALPLAAQSSHA